MPIIQIGHIIHVFCRAERPFRNGKHTFDRYAPIGRPVNVGAMAGVITWNGTNESPWNPLRINGNERETDIPLSCGSISAIVRYMSVTTSPTACGR
jgi:hypothetical protein